MGIGLQRDIQPEGAEGEIVVVDRGLPRRPPVRRAALHVRVVGGVEADVVEPAVGEAAVSAGLEIQMLVDERVGGRPDHQLCERAADDRTGAALRNERRGDVGKGPGRRRVPEILHGRVVVDRDADHGVGAEQRQRLRVTDVGVVPAEMARVAAVGRLGEHADVLTETRRDEQRHLIDGQVVVAREVRRGSVGLRRRGAAEAALDHEGERQRLLARAEGIAVELELAAVGGERRPEGEGVALGACKAGLACVARHRARALREREQHESDERGECAGRDRRWHIRVKAVTDEGKRLPG